MTSELINIATEIVSILATSTSNTDFNELVKKFNRNRDEKKDNMIFAFCVLVTHILRNEIQFLDLEKIELNKIATYVLAEALKRNKSIRKIRNTNRKLLVQQKMRFVVASYERTRQYYKFFVLVRLAWPAFD